MMFGADPQKLAHLGVNLQQEYTTHLGGDPLVVRRKAAIRRAAATALVAIVASGVTPWLVGAAKAAPTIGEERRGVSRPSVRSFRDAIFRFV